jgi:hypothetical protein
VKFIPLFVPRGELFELSKKYNFELRKGLLPSDEGRWLGHKRRRRVLKARILEKNRKFGFRPKVRDFKLPFLFYSKAENLSPLRSKRGAVMLK